MLWEIAAVCLWENALTQHAVHAWRSLFEFPCSTIRLPSIFFIIKAETEAARLFTSSAKCEPFDFWSTLPMRRRNSSIGRLKKKIKSNRLLYPEECRENPVALRHFSFHLISLSLPDVSSSFAFLLSALL